MQLVRVSEATNLRIRPKAVTLFSASGRKQPLAPGPEADLAKSSREGAPLGLGLGRLQSSDNSTSMRLPYQAHRSIEMRKSTVALTVGDASVERGSGGA